ncbi:MAG: FAD:protein FMN transferase [Rhodopseudomonas sp.]|nr:FAD:protein FMN transferase [Rhodopseudomonas sp.]
MASDCTVHLQARADEDLPAIAAAAEDEVRRIEWRYSRYRDDSVLARINRVATAGGSISIDDETAGLIDYAFACFRQSGGQFDISSGLLRAAWDFSQQRLPDQMAINRLLPRIGLGKVGWAESRLSFTQAGMELDFGGIGKEYAADRAAEVCLGHGAGHGFVDLGGDIRVIGPQVDGEPWRIGIRDPRQANLSVATIELHGGALATSGDYERFIDVDGRRYCHILDPTTGWPAHGLSSVTVLADRCLIAGTMSTIAMLKGRAGPGWLQQLGLRHIAVDDKGGYAGTEPIDRQAV